METVTVVVAVALISGCVALAGRAVAVFRNNPEDGEDGEDSGCFDDDIPCDESLADCGCVGSR